MAGKTSGQTQSPAGHAPEAAIHGSEFTSTAELKTIHFDFDRYDLTKESLRIIEQNAEAIKNNKDWEVLVEGHCDEWGTSEYNLSLGQKRAKAVRDHYMRLGISGTRIATLSYGEEKPACAQPKQNCWAENRRAESKIKTKTAEAEAKSKVDD